MVHSLVELVNVLAAFRIGDPRLSLRAIQDTDV